MIDETDHQILSLLQDDARLPNAEIARRLGMAASAIHERIKKLEARGLIQAYEARLDPGPLGRKLLAFVFVRSDELPGEALTGDRLAAIPEVLEVHHVAGEDCYLAKVRCSDTEELGRLLRQRFGSIPTVRSTRTTIVLGTLKESGKLPLPDRPAGKEGDHD
jgi:Lrp/AsnC family leucine-responsive transcriptional regulator